MAQAADIMRAREFVSESQGPRGKSRAAHNHEFEQAHPGLILPAGRDDLYAGRYYDFYRISSLAGMDPDQLDQVDEISSLGNLPMFSAYTEYDRIKLKKIMKKLGMNPTDNIGPGSLEPRETNNVSPVKPFKGYAK